MARCRSCDREIEWGLLNGKPHPLDPGPIPDGNLYETPTVERGSRVVRAVSKDAPAPEYAARRRSHFATCPNAPSHRKTR